MQTLFDGWVGYQFFKVALQILNRKKIFVGKSYLLRYKGIFYPYGYTALGQEISVACTIRCLRVYYIVACQRGGISNKPTLSSGQRQDTRSGILWSVHRWTNLTILAMTTLYKIFKKKRTIHLIRFLLRHGEPGTSQYSILGPDLVGMAAVVGNIVG